MDWTDPGAPALLNGQKPNWLATKPVSQLLMPKTDVIVEGLWRREEIILLGGHAKSWKTWAQMDLMYCISNGLGWLAWPKTTKGKVLCLDLELFPFEIRRRFESIAQSYGHSIANCSNIELVSLRGQNFTLADFSSLKDYLKAGHYIAISIDPTYRMLAGAGISESDPGVISDLMNRSLQIATTLNAGIDLMQHFSKGSQSDKRAIDAYSGSGVWGRAPDACLTFREHNDERCYTVTADVRHWPNIDPFVVEFDFPRFRLRQGKDPENLKRTKAGRPTSFTVESLCNLIEGQEYISYSALRRRSQAAHVAKRTFDRRLKEAKHQGWLATNPTDSTYFLTAIYVSKFRTYPDEH